MSGFRLDHVSSAPWKQHHLHLQAMIIAALRYWVQEMHVDGFRFDLGSIMTRAHSVWHPATDSGNGSESRSSQGQAAAPSGNGAPASNGATSAAEDDLGAAHMCHHAGQAASRLPSKITADIVQ